MRCTYFSASRNRCTAPRRIFGGFPNDIRGFFRHLYKDNKIIHPALAGGQKMLDFARKKLPEHPHPTLTVLDKNIRALALYRRMGWKVCGVELVFDPAKDRFAAVHSELLVMRYEG